MASSSQSEAAILSQAREKLGPILQFLAEQPVQPVQDASGLPTNPALPANSAIPPSLMSLITALPRDTSTERGQVAQQPMAGPPPLRPQQALAPLSSPLHQQPLGPPPQLLQTHQQPIHTPASTMSAPHSIGQAQRFVEDGLPTMDHQRHPSASAQSSIDNDSGEEDEDDPMSAAGRAMTRPDDRRMAHTVAEQKRRDDIKHGYEELAKLIPSCQAGNNGGQKLSKAIILQRSIDYMTHLKKYRQTQDQDLAALRNEVMALRIMKRNYEQIAKAHQAQPPENLQQVSDAAKFEVFKAVMDTLFQSFDASISVNSFESLSGTIFNWLEEFCKPQNMRGIVINSLQTSQKGPAGVLYSSHT